MGEKNPMHVLKKYQKKKNASSFYRKKSWDVPSLQNQAWEGIFSTFRITSKTGTDFLAGLVAIGQEVVVLNWRNKNEGGKTPEQVAQWGGGCPIPGNFKVRLDGALSNLTDLKISQLIVEGLEQMTLKCPF